MDDLYAAPLVVTPDTETSSFEFRVNSNPGVFEWTVGYFKDFEGKSTKQLKHNMVLALMLLTT